MTSGTWTGQQFECPKCGMWYVATHEQDPEAKPGRFSCTVCGTEIKSWSGIDSYFDWKQTTMKSPHGDKL
jgi:transcription elongation factor Elf1